MTQEEQQLDPAVLEQVEALIQDATARLEREAPDLDQAESDLRQALELLPDPQDPQARELWGAAGEGWRALVEHTPDVERSEELLQEGARYFTHQPVGEQLEAMLKLNRQVFSLKNALALPPGKGWPVWFEEPNAHKWFQSLIRNADELMEDPSWPALRQAGERYRALLLGEYLPAYLDQLSQQAHGQARQGDIARALQTAQQALQFIPSELAESLPESLQMGDMEVLDGAIRARQECEVALWRAIVALVDGSTSFRGARSRIELDLPRHPDVAVDDLQAALDDLEKAAELEGALDQFSGQQGYSTDFQELERRGQVHFESLDQPAEFLIRSDPQTYKKFQNLLRQLRERAVHGPEHNVRELISDLESSQETDALLESYWRLVWFLEQGLVEDSDTQAAARQALSDVRRNLEEMLSHAAQLFAAVHSEQALNQFLRFLNTLQVLNRGLASYPQAREAYPQSEALPPLPEGVELPESETDLDAGALSDWEEIVYAWLERSHADQPLGQEAQDQAAILEGLEGSALQYMQDAARLGEQVWSRLGLDPWDRNSFPGRLESGGELFLLVVSVLREADLKMESRSAVDNARSWTRRFHSSGLALRLEEPMLWLLEPHRAAALSCAQDLKEAISAGLDEQIAGLLQEQPPSGDKLHQEVLAVRLSGEFALAARSSIQDHAARLAQAARNRGDPHAALDIAQAVRQASSPWAEKVFLAPFRDDPNAELWRDLHRWARWEYRKALLFTRRRLVLAGAVALVVLLVALGFGGSALLSRAGEDGREAMSAAQTGTALAFHSAALTATQRAPAQTATAALNASETAAYSATRQALQELNVAAMVKAGATATARQEVLLEQTAVARATQSAQSALDATATMAADPAYQATAAALRCLSDPSAYGVEIVEGPVLNPDLRTVYAMGSPVFSATASWTIRNAGDCDWTSLSVAPYQDARQVNYFLWKDSRQIELSEENPLQVGQTLRIYLGFQLTEARDIDEAWNLVANGVEIQGGPHLELAVEDWIIVLQPTPTPTPGPKKRPSGGGGDPTSRTPAPPPPSRP